jgi:hypothetical protein
LISPPPPPLTNGTNLPRWQCQHITPCMNGCHYRRRCFCPARRNIDDSNNCVGEGSSVEGTSEEKESTSSIHRTKSCISAPDQC